MHAVASIINAIFAPSGQWRTLRDIVIQPEIAPNTPFLVGNSSIVVAAKLKGEDVIVKCYTRNKPHLCEIYGPHFYPSELKIYNLMCERHYVDCVIYPLIKGTPLDKILATRGCNLKALADALEELARDLLDKPYAHGDIKPENIIVAEDGTMHLIDWDAAFLPKFAGERASETGTAAFQHPMRSTYLFNEHIDDYSIAYLLTMLRRISIDDNALEAYLRDFCFLPAPPEIVSAASTTLNEIVALFASLGMAKEAAIARLLTSPTHALPTLRHILNKPISHTDAPIELKQEGGKWGLRSRDGWVIAPLYDSLLEPRHGITVACIDGYYSILKIFCDTRYDIGQASHVKLDADGSVIYTDRDEMLHVVCFDDILQ